MAEAKIRLSLDYEEVLRGLNDIKGKLGELSNKTGVSDEFKELTGVLGKLEQKVRDLNREMRMANDPAEVKRLAAEIRNTEGQIAKLTQEAKKTGEATKEIGKEGNKLTSIFKNVGTVLLAAFSVTKLVQYAKEMGNLVIDTDRLRLAMRNALKTQEDYESSLLFVQKLANDYGQDVNILTKSFTLFAASTTNSTLSLEEVQRVYKSIIVAGSALKMSNYDIEGSLYAVQQMFSKGMVQSEELRRQLGDRLPGAFNILADALGVTTAGLDKMLRNGEVLADDALPKFAKALENLYSDKAKSILEVIPNQFNRIKNAFIEYINDANQANQYTHRIADAMGKFADGLPRVLDLITKTVKTVGSLGVAYVSVRAGVLAYQGASVLLNGVLQAGTIIKGQAALAVATLDKSTDRLTIAQQRAAVSARSFNAAIASNPWGLALVALTALYVGFKTYRVGVNEALEKQAEFDKGLVKATSNIENEQREFNTLSAIVLDNNRKLSEREAALNKLKQMQPDYMAGINTIKDAEANLGGVLSLVNGEYVKRAQLAKIAYQIEQNNKSIEARTARGVELDKILSDRDNEKNILGRDIGRNLFRSITGNTTENLRREQAENETVIASIFAANDALTRESMQVQAQMMEGKNKEVKNFIEGEKDKEKATKKTVSEFEKSIKASKKEYEKYTKDLEKLKDKEIDAIRERNEKEAELAREEIENAKAKHKEKENQNLAFALNAKIQEAKTVEDLEKIQKEHNAELERLEKDRLKKEAEQAEKRLEASKANYKKLKDEETKVLKELETARDNHANILKRQSETKNQQEWDNIDVERKASEESIKVLGKKLENIRKEQKKELSDTSKYQKELVKLEQEKTKLIEKEGKDSYDKLHTTLKLKADVEQEFSKLSIKGQEEYMRDRLKNWDDMTDEELMATIKHIKAMVDSEQEGYKRREKNLRDYIKLSEALVDGLGAIIMASLDSQLSRTNSATEKALIENQKMWVKWGTDVLSTVGKIVEGIEMDKLASLGTNIAKGDWIGVGLQSVGVIAQGVINLITARARRAKAELEELGKFVEEQQKRLDTMTKAGEKVFQSFFEKPTWFLDWEEMGFGFDDDPFGLAEMFGNSNWIQNQIAMVGNDMVEIAQRAAEIGDNIQTAYKVAVDKETEYHNTVIKNIEDRYKEIVKTITDEYDLRARLAKERYDEDSLALKEQAAQSLNNIIGNNADAKAVWEEYYTWLADINAQTALADTVITDDMSEAQIQAIREMQDLRNKYHNDALGNLIDELKFIADSEDGKRKIYSETDEILNELKDKQRELDLEYQAEQIQLNQERQVALIQAEVDKNLLIENETGRHNDVIIKMTTSRDQMMTQSFEIYRDAVLNGYNIMIQAANKAYRRGAMTAEQYRQTVRELDNLYRKLSNFPISSTVNNPYNPNIQIPMGFASGTESVPLMGNPKGVDTVPTMLTAGERVMTVQQNKMLGGISNQDLVKKAINYDALMAGIMPKDMPILRLKPSVNQILAEGKLAMETLMNMNMKPLIDEMRANREEISKLPINNFTIDENGIRRWYKKGNNVVIYNKKRYG